MLSSPIEFRHWVKKSILCFLHRLKHFLKCTTANTMAFTVAAICHAITVYGVHMQSSHLYQLSSIRMARVQRSLWIGIATCTLAWVRFWKQFFPSVSRAYQKYPIPAGLTRMAGAFMGCVVNIGSVETPVQTEPHRDVKESVFGVSCLCPFGDYSQGGIILWELEMVIELAAGDYSHSSFKWTYIWRTSFHCGIYSTKCIRLLEKEVWVQRQKDDCKSTEEEKSKSKSASPTI